MNKFIPGGNSAGDFPFFNGDSPPKTPLANSLPASISEHFFQFAIKLVISLLRFIEVRHGSSLWKFGSSGSLEARLPNFCPLQPAPSVRFRVVFLSPFFLLSLMRSDLALLGLTSSVA